MPTLLSFPEELLLKIGFAVRKPADILHFCQACQHLGKLAMPLLYEHVAFDVSRYHETGDSETDLPRAIEAFLRKLKDTSSSCPTTRSLSIHVEAPPGLEGDCVSRLLPYLPTLRRLEINVRAPCWFPAELRDICDIRGLYFLVGGSQLTRIPLALPSCQNHLQSLSLFADFQDSLRDGTSIGNLRQFTTLEHLDLQASVLIGGKEARSSDWMTSLADRLPLALKTLQIRCYGRKMCTQGFKGSRPPPEIDDTIELGLQTSVLLTEFLSRESRPQKLLRGVTIWESPFPNHEDDRAKPFRKALLRCGQAISSDNIVFTTRLVCANKSSGCKRCKADLEKVKTSLQEDCRPIALTEDGEMRDGEIRVMGNGS